MIRSVDRKVRSVALLLLLAACSSTGNVLRSAPEEKAPETDVVIVLRHDVQLLDSTTKITIAGTGAVEVLHLRKSDGSTVDTTTRKVDPALVVEAINGLFDLGFLDMPNKYEGVTHKIQRRESRYQPLLTVTADGSCSELTLKIGVWVKTVSECNSAPEPLRKAHARISELAGEQF
jgi:hypothetical protein